MKKVFMVMTIVLLLLFCTTSVSANSNRVVSGVATHYCACSKCNGKWAGTTASGIKIYNGMKNPYIVACNWLPLGTKLKVNGVLYTVKDTGGKDFNKVGRIDIFTPGGHNAAYKLGVKNVKIEIIK